MSYCAIYNQYDYVVERIYSTVEFSPCLEFLQTTYRQVNNLDGYDWQAIKLINL